MVDLEHYYLASLLVDPVENSKGSSPRRPYAFQLVAELAAESMRVLDQWTGDEIDDGDGDCFWKQLRYRPCGRAGDD